MTWKDRLLDVLVSLLDRVSPEKGTSFCPFCEEEHGRVLLCPVTGNPLKDSRGLLRNIAPRRQQVRAALRHFFRH